MQDSKAGEGRLGIARLSWCGTGARMLCDVRYMCLGEDCLAGPRQFGFVASQCRDCINHFFGSFIAVRLRSFDDVPSYRI
ncbi:hypothetical protein MA16_Dca005058 [Dendrobium catenatum]|uniref:Uncharacterized protein n=1 Tax=Dendrobium catenatum TaxID=906689 RepID=A0A2I0WGR8_9ASPA|nr:hypothetical protein MA16_Dca005058 [Dendrobium catenatum]